MTTTRTQHKQELAAELEPLAPSHRGFERRLPPVTRAELDSMDRLRAVADAVKGEAS
jgi:hypothetical protein